MRAFPVLLLVLALAAAAAAKPEKKLEPTFDDLGHIHGYLVTPAGQGITGVVGLALPGGGVMSHHLTDSFRKGRFDIDNLLPGRYELRVLSVGPTVTDLAPPPPLVVEVRPDRVSRPRLTAVLRPR